MKNGRGRTGSLRKEKIKRNPRQINNEGSRIGGRGESKTGVKI